MAGENHSCLINHYWADETKLTDGRGDLTDLLWGMRSGVARIWF